MCFGLDRQFLKIVCLVPVQVATLEKNSFGSIVRGLVLQRTQLILKYRATVNQIGKNRHDSRM